MELFLYNSPAFDNFLKNNPHERGEVRFLESIVKEGMNVIDIGANAPARNETLLSKKNPRHTMASPDVASELRVSLVPAVFLD
jgi:hypothetical protein